MSEPLNYDDNGITGLFFSHSEVVFRRFQNKKLSARGFSLWYFFPSLLFSSTCCLSFYALYCRPFFLICKEFFTNSKKYLYLSIGSFRNTFYTFYHFHMDMGHLDIPYPLSRLFLIFSVLSIIRVFFPV